MKIRVLGCSGAIARDCRTTAFLVDESLLVDAGTGVGDLSLDEMARIDHVLLTHSHLDHIAALPLMADAISARRSTPICVHALPGTVVALRAHIFNDLIWPDFTRLPSPQAPFIRLHKIEVGQVLAIAGKQIEVLPAAHTVPAVGFAVSEGGPCWVFTGDTGPNPAFWRRVNQLNVGALVIETAFSDHEAPLARRSQHLCPQALAQELAQINARQAYPVYITHTKPAETAAIMGEIGTATAAPPALLTRRIVQLQAGQFIEL
ncbi:3',5'-cyclic-nucleotide phosphodiesterase [Xylophilus sp. GW821-FHT01B05]